MKEFGNLPALLTLVVLFCKATATPEVWPPCSTGPYSRPFPGRPNCDKKHEPVSRTCTRAEYEKLKESEANLDQNLENYRVNGQLDPKKIMYENLINKCWIRFILLTAAILFFSKPTGQLLYEHCVSFVKDEGLSHLICSGLV
ncbi:hypothetical protein GALMADRAFT_257735 [Galerina marginata CBS 339.88]|uniref:Uncharacterized protein n=1 Tax=Galerina marginata (strain CBS 339.88) TaxID=685588 RepID=A0A067SAH3_GALM3|nr:hypothetical protein GALMADRAFT_257735 [Galerina marginata CBS 339.88]